MKLLEGKTAIVTGAARGIGKAIALKFASEGANIAFTDLVIDENGKKTEEEIKALGVECKAYASNAANFAETEQVVNQIKEDFGRIDILVNNAGITKDGLMMRMTEAQWDAVIAVNLKSAFNFIHAVLPIMMRQRSGSIINMASVVGVHGNAGQANYAASKAGLIALAKSIAQEVGSRGIRANAIAPGFIETAMTAALPDSVREEWCKKIPLRRGGKPEDIADVATFLASDLSSYVSGQVIFDFYDVAGNLERSTGVSSASIPESRGCFVIMRAFAKALNYSSDNLTKKQAQTSSSVGTKIGVKNIIWVLDDLKALKKVDFDKISKHGVHIITYNNL